jgi:AcrR family transcriptional regulator
MAQATTAPSRADRRRQETRERLLRAAHRVIARKGPEAATVAEITEAADVGLGTFYHHFESKDAVLEPLIESVAEATGAALDAATADLSDPAEVMATAVRHMVRRVVAEPLWGHFVLRMGGVVPDRLRPLLQRQARDLERGVASGRFVVANVDVVRAALPGLVLGIFQARLRGALPDDCDVDAAATALQLLGLPPQEAREIASRPIPPFPLASPLGTAAADKEVQP